MWMDHLERGKLWRGLRAHHGVDIFEGLQNKKKQLNRKPCSREPGGLQSLKYLRGGPTHYLEDWRIYFQAATENVKFPWSPVYLHTLWKPVILSHNMLVFVLLFKKYYVLPCTQNLQVKRLLLADRKSLFHGFGCTLRPWETQMVFTSNKYNTHPVLTFTSFHFTKWLFLDLEPKFWDHQQ